MSAEKVNPGGAMTENDDMGPGKGAVPFPAPLAPYAVKARRSRGRLVAEPPSASRTPFQRDRDRVIHAASFRRLKHKTQVFIYHEGDHFRTRLTHSLEVAQVGRSIARLLQLDEDLTETIALAHDLGHPPFGHTGEEVLDECMKGAGGFDHNAQTLRVLTKLERRHARFDGLNLTWEALEGVVKHNGPLLGAVAEAQAAAKKQKPLKPLPAALEEYSALQDLELHTFPSIEAQIAALADDIAYNNHDTDDGLRAGLFTLEEAMDVPVVGEAICKVRRTFPDAPEELIIAEAVSAMIGEMIADVVRQTRLNIAASGVASYADVRHHSAMLVAFSDDMAAKVAALRRFLWARMYRHHRLNRARSHARRVIQDLFSVFSAEPDTLPPEWFNRFEVAGRHKLSRIICDYIAGMTDRYAIIEHRRLFNVEKWI